MKLGGKISRVLFLILFSLEKSAYSLTPPCPQLHPEREDRNASSTLGQKASFLPAQDIVLSHPLDTTLVIYSSENLATNSGSCHYLRFLRLSWETQGLFMWRIQLWRSLVFMVKAPYLRRQPTLEVISAASLHDSSSRFRAPLLPSYTALSFFRYLTGLLPLHLLSHTHHDLQSLAFPPTPEASKPYCGAFFFFFPFCTLISLGCYLILTVFCFGFSTLPLGKISTLIPLTSSSSDSMPYKWHKEGEKIQTLWMSFTLNL